MICNSCIIVGNRLCLHLTQGEKAIAKKGKNTAQDYTLTDQEGQEWARATLSLTRLNALIKEYKRQGIHLTPSERVSA